MHIRAVLALSALLGPMLSAAEVFRCTDAAGKVEYSDAPCANGSGKVILVNQTVLPGPSPRELALVDENRRLRGELEARAAAAAPAPVIGRSDADLAAEKGGSQECAQARKNLDFYAGSRQFERDPQADELAVYVACGIRPPDRIVNVTGAGGAGVYRPFAPRFFPDAKPERPPRPVAAPVGPIRAACASPRGCL
jgi:hypothetical protein